LINQYGQIVNNYDILIASDRRNNVSEKEIALKESKRDIVQKQINNYQEEQDVCNKRLVMSYAILTALKASSSDMGETYYTVDVNIPVRSTSF